MVLWSDNTGCYLSDDFWKVHLIIFVRVATHTVPLWQNKFDVAAVIEESLNQQCTQRNCANENNAGILSRLLSSQYIGVVPDEKSVARHTVNLLTSTIKVVYFAGLFHPQRCILCR
ncbi:hypothetical protein P8452_66449 [Trifolium repens]|nr:hypothetical protein P8452_66449 [Trifolium repens]